MAETWSDISTEILHLYPSGGRLVGVAGADAERSRRAADDLAAALDAAGQTVERAHTTDGDEQALRTDVIAPFRAGSDDRVLVVSGPASLLDAGARGLWNYSVWQLAGDEKPHTAASALVQLDDPATPFRRFADFCALPGSFGA